MDRRLTIEVQRLKGESVEELLSAVLDAGAVAVPGFEPVPMAGEPSTVCVTVEVVDDATEDRIRQLPNVVGVYGDPQIEGFSSPEQR